MAGGKLSARQKMINLMYLVFIAMMALNIDREVLRSFDDVNSSLVRSNQLATKNNEAFVGSMRKTAETDAKYADAVQKSEAMMAKAKPLVDYIESLKGKLAGKEARIDENGEPVYAVLSNLESVTNLFFKSDTNVTPDAEGLVTKIKDFNAYLTSIGKGNLGIDISDYKAKGKPEETWLHRKFYGQPQVAAETSLTKIQNDAINAQAEVIRSFLSQKVLENVEINDFKGVIASPGYVEIGKPANTYAAIGAFDNRLQGNVTVNGRTYPLIDGKANIPLETGSAGIKTLSGSISFKDAKGQQQTRPLESMQYEVVQNVVKTKAEAAAAVTADNMNVFYVGLDNPVSAAVVGIEPASLKMSGPGLSYKGNGKGTIKPTSVGKVDIVVSGQSLSGGSFSKSFPFRVKNLPKPEGTVLGKTFLELPAGSLKMQKVSARFVDFEWPLNINVTGFKYKITGRGTQIVSGNSLGSITAKAGQVISIFDIKGTANGVSLKDATTVVIEVKE